jgi:hypothetical protein
MAFSFPHRSSNLFDRRHDVMLTGIVSIMYRDGQEPDEIAARQVPSGQTRRAKSDRAGTKNITSG